MYYAIMNKKVLNDEALAGGHAKTERGDVAAGNRWNLAPLYDSITKWNDDFEAIKKRAPEILKFQGKLADSVAIVRDAFNLYLELSRSLEKVYTFAHLMSDEDTSNSTNLGYLDKTVSLYGEFSALASYIVPELLTIDSKKLDSYLKSAELTHLTRALNEIIRYKPHTLSKEEEAIIAHGTELYGASEKIFSQLTNADFVFPDVEVGDKRFSLTHGAFSLLLKSHDREVRKQAFANYYETYAEHKFAIAASLSSSVKTDLFMTRVKKYPSTLARSLFADDVSREVYDTLIQTVSDNLEPLHRYYELRKKLLKHDELYMYDTYVPLVANVEHRMGYDTAVSTVVESLEPLGKEYTSVLQRGLSTERWVDRYENIGKRSGAYSSGCYDSFPYMLLNYREEDINSVFTLTHEAGHSMHSYFSRKHQPYQDHSYTIFVAEVASIFNEELLLKHMRRQYANDPRMTAFLINHEIDEIKATLFRQTMFAEFERTVHDFAEQGGALTITYFVETYRGLLKKYFGEAVTVRDIDALECLRIPHFYSAFYVYKYATGISAAIALARQVAQGGAAERDRYVKFLCSGCTKPPLELLRDAGVDMRTPEAIKEAIAHFGSLVNELAVALT